MAIDTAEKRRSAAGIGFYGLPVAVTPNASKDQEWRQQAGWSYSGIEAGEAQPVYASILFRGKKIGPLFKGQKIGPLFKGRK